MKQSRAFCSLADCLWEGGQGGRRGWGGAKGKKRIKNHHRWKGLLGRVLHCTLGWRGEDAKGLSRAVRHSGGKTEI